MLFAPALLCVLALTPTPPEDKKGPPAEFSCQLGLSADITFEDRWFHTDAASGVRADTTSRVVRGQVFKVLVMIVNPTPDSSGKSNVRMDISCTRPDGKSYFDEQDLVAYGGGATRNVQLAGTVIGVSFDPEDPLGKYSVRAVLRDVVAKRECVREAQIELVEAIEGKTFGTGDEAVDAVMSWSMTVDAAKEPHRLITALTLVAGADLMNDGSKGVPLRTFFREAFDAHPFLYRSLGKLVADPATNEIVRSESLRILEQRRTPEAKRLDVLPELARTATKGLELKQAWNPREGAIEEPGHLDQLWTTFFATGSFKAIERITTVLDLDPTGKTRASVMHKAARWSLGSIAKRNELAKAYLEFMAKHEQTPAARKAILAEILAD